MEIDWSKAPECYDVHIKWSDREDHFYECRGDRYVRDGGMYVKKGEIDGCGGIISFRPWSGKGLPPVGIKCENRVGSHWQEVLILAHDFLDGEHRAVFRFNGDGHVSYFGDPAEAFRPIRTAEQIAAEERQKAIEELGHFLSRNSNTPTPYPYLLEVAQKIYDAGYRKQATK